MESNLLGQKLNSILDSIAQLDNSINRKVTFNCGDYPYLIGEKLSKTAISQKVAIFSYEKTFLSLSKNIKKSLEKHNIVSLDYLFSKKENINLESLSKLFVLPEDIRAIIVTDSFLSKIAGFYATIKNIPLYIISCGLDIGESLENTFFLKGDREYKAFEISCEKHFIIDQNLVEVLGVSLSIAFDYIVNNIVSLIDEKISAFYLGEKPKAKLYNQKNRAVVNTFNIMRYSPQDRYFILVENSVVCGLINANYGKDLLEINSLEIVKLLIFKDGFARDSVLLAYAIKIIKLYALLCEQEIQNLFVINDFNALTENVAEILDIKEESIIDDLIKKQEKLTNSEKNQKDFLSKFAGEIIPLSKAIESASSIHLLLNGENLQGEIQLTGLKEFFGLCGAYGKKLTGLSLFTLFGLNKIK